ncbi:Blp family class II bacteriocin [Clostridium sp. UBA1652]|uniref:Blp family class II bacteriocin n=1 Tax=Clostridium sp. UBA1652 TaxID=1946348 RepID=UPI00257E0BA9|nr:Blp family class II bacteriocin [Clostridium sp. UBA1652]
MEITLNSNFMSINSDELITIDGGVNWDRVFNGVAIAGGALIGIAGVVTAPIWVPALGAFAIGTSVGYYILY